MPKNNSDIVNYFNQYIDAYYHISSSILNVCYKYLHNNCLNCPFNHTLFHEKHNCEFGEIGALDIIKFRNYCEQIIEILEVYDVHT